MQHLRKLYAPVANLAFLDFLPQCQDFIHGTALHIPLHEENPPPALKNINDLWQADMVELFQDFSFIFQFCLGYEFDGPFVA